MNMVKVLPLRFQECLGPFARLVVEGFSETELFRHLSNYFFRTGSVEKAKIQKKFFASEIIASEDVAIDSLY